jgi:hypothetical protein
MTGTQTGAGGPMPPTGRRTDSTTPTASGFVTVASSSIGPSATIFGP